MMLDRVARANWRLNESELLHAAVERAVSALVASQQRAGHWSYELEADCTIPAEYILMMHFMGEVDTALQAKLAVFIRAHQAIESHAGYSQTLHHGWPLYEGGDFDLSCSVKAYYALKLAGDDVQAPHMAAARNAILARGGAARANVFTRIALALFGQVPWRAVPFMPVEIILLPRWFPFHIDKVSYWSRTVMVPLLILCSLRAQARNQLRVGIGELFVVPAEDVTDYFPARSVLRRLFLLLDRTGRWLEPCVPRWIRDKALQRAENWIIERRNGHGGLGAIFPAMVNAHEALALRGYPATHPYRQDARQALEDLLVVDDDRAYCQPCMSPRVGYGARLSGLAGSRQHAGGRAWSVVAAPAPVARRTRRLAARSPVCRGRWLAVSVQQRPLSRHRRYQRCGLGDDAVKGSPESRIRAPRG